MLYLLPTGRQGVCVVTLEATSSGQSRPYPGSESCSGKVSHIVKSPMCVCYFFILFIFFTTANPLHLFAQSLSSIEPLCFYVSDLNKCCFCHMKSLICEYASQQFCRGVCWVAVLLSAVMREPESR